MIIAVDLNSVKTFTKAYSAVRVNCGLGQDVPY